MVKNTIPKTDRRSASDQVTSSISDSTTNPKTFSPIWILLDQIDLTEAGRLRENDNLELVDEYAEVFRQHMQDGKLVKGENQTKFPFPPCSAYKRSDGRWGLPAGRHRALAAQKAGLKRIWCTVYSDEKEAIWDGLGDNRKNGLRNSPGDLKKMISFALEKYVDKSHRLIAEHIGCSATYVDRIAKELEQVQTCLHLTPATRKGRDGKEYPAKKLGKPKKVEPTADTEEKSEKEMEEANVLFATSSGSQEDATTVSDIESLPAPTSITPLPQVTAIASEKVETTPRIEVKETAPPAVETISAPSVADSITENALSRYLSEFFGGLPDDDEKRLNFSELLVRQILLGKFNGEQRRSDLFQRVETLLQKFGPK